MPSKQNVIVLMTMMMMMEAVPLECCWWFIYTVLKLSCHAMNYGSIEERAERKKIHSPIKSWQTKWNAIFIIYNIYTGCEPMEWALFWPERETEWNSNNQTKYKHFGHSLTNSLTQTPTKAALVDAWARLWFDICIDRYMLQCLFSIWHITPLFDRMCEICELYTLLRLVSTYVYVHRVAHTTQHITARPQPSIVQQISNEMVAYLIT